MATITENLQTIKDSTAAIKSAILEKGGTIEGNLTTYASAIANLPSGDVNPTAEKNEVTFYDYDGTIRYSYTAEEFLALTEMPPLPTQKGLICQEWNWSFEDAREYVAEYGILDVGATYITDDGKTRLYIRIAAEGRMDVPLYFQQTIANGVTIDWGDGSAKETLDGTGKVNTTHRYANIGDYMISLDVADGCRLILGHGTDYNSTLLGSYWFGSTLQRICVGKNTDIPAYAFRMYHALETVVLPNHIITITSTAFYQCYSLRFVVIPASTIKIDTNSFRECQSLELCILSNRLQTLNSYSFFYNYSLKAMIFPKSISSYGGTLFTYNKIIRSLVIPSTMLEIKSDTFSNMLSMAFYDFSHHTAVPTLNNVNAFTDIPSDCKIIVPDALYDEWILATNWSTYASYIIKKTEWDARNNQ